MNPLQVHCREASLLKMTDHPNILKFIGLHESPDIPVGLPALISPWKCEGHLLKFIKTHEDANRADLVRYCYSCD